MSVVISCFEGPADEELVIAQVPKLRVHRALYPDAPFRYITAGESVPEARRASGKPATAVSGTYEVWHSREEAAEPFAPGRAAEPVVFINCMVVEPGREQAAFAKWHEVNAYMVRKPGYQWHTLHGRENGAAPFGRVNIAGWESADAWRAAHDEGFRALTVVPDLPFRPVPALCELVRDACLQA